MPFCWNSASSWSAFPTTVVNTKQPEIHTANGGKITAVRDVDTDQQRGDSFAPPRQPKALSISRRSSKAKLRKLSPHSPFSAGSWRSVDEGGLRWRRSGAGTQEVLFRSWSGRIRRSPSNGTQRLDRNSAGYVDDLWMGDG